MKCCGLCKYIYQSDMSDITGFDCEKNKYLKIIKIEELHPYCNGQYKVSWGKLLIWWIKYA